MNASVKLESLAKYLDIQNEKRPTVCRPHLVRMARLELAQENSHYPLKVARLPFRHIRFDFGIANIRTYFELANFSSIFFKKNRKNSVSNLFPINRLGKAG